MASLASPTTRAQRRPVLALLAVVAAACLLTLGLLYAAGYRPLVVASGSMAPAVDTGDLIITRAIAPSRVVVGDVVSFHDRSREGGLVTHRVAAVHRAGRQVALVTRGDVNSGVERWSTAADARIGKLALRIPHAGYAVTWVTRLPIILALLAIVLLAFVRAVGAARGSRRAVRRVSGSALSALASAAMIISVPLMFSATEGAFSAVTANAANSFQAAATFCSSATLNATADTALTESSPGTNHGGLVELAVQSETGQNIRSLVKFAVPTVPAGCTMTSARLRLTLTPSAVVFGFYLGMGRTLQALHVTGAWTENGATWTNKPATTTINQALYATGFAVAPHDFTVTSQVAAMIAAPATNNGFLIRDSVENDSGSQPYHSRQAASGVPTLTITYAPS